MDSLGFSRDSLNLHDLTDAPKIRPYGGLNSSAASLNSRHSKATTTHTSADRHDVMIKYLHKKCMEHKWLESPDTETDSEPAPTTCTRGVILKRSPNNYAIYPLDTSSEVLQAVERSGATVALTMSSSFTDAFFERVSPDQTEIPLDPYGSVLSIVDSVTDLFTTRSTVLPKAYLCACRRERMVLLWGDSAQNIISHGSATETRLVGLVYGTIIATESGPPTSPSPLSFQNRPISNSLYNLMGTDRIRSLNTSSVYEEKHRVIEAAIAREERGPNAYDPEKDPVEAPKRPFLLTHAVLVGLAMILAVIVEMACVAKMITEVRLDGNMVRFALLAVIPVFATFSLFFMIVITGSLFQIFGPLTGVQNNSMFYSAKAPEPDRYPNLELPHITIQMPVYKEGLKGVIIPTITSIVSAVKFYESKGGTASIFVNDDGMQLVKPELAEARKAFYDINHIGWCSRPKHCTEEGPNHFIRKGQFKKASNMNYCLDFSIRVEDEMFRLMEQLCRERDCSLEDLTIEDETVTYEKARDTIVERDGGKTLAGGDVRIGEIILLIDSDTRVPENCLLFGALELHESPEVALLQHASGILQVVNNAFENGISYFTNLVYTSIQFAVGNGDAAPFVGHNTFIRWKAIQSIAWEADGMTKFWSDDHVSEDFDVSLRLQMENFVVRLATYHDGGFMEGVSLTVYDEIARWEKYAYGCNELVFNPLYKWPWKGPFTRLFIRFLFSNIKITSKITILGYIGTYYAVASAIPLTLVNYLLVGWFQDSIDQFYLTSWKIFVGMAVVFNILSPLGYAMLRHRLGQKTFFVSLGETIKWTPFFLLFFGGVSYHLLKAICCHFFSIKMEWTTTAKELEASGFRIGLDRIVSDFKIMYAIVFFLAGGMIYLGCFASYDWYITDFSAIVPLANQVGCHALLPDYFDYRVG